MSYNPLQVKMCVEECLRRLEPTLSTIKENFRKNDYIMVFQTYDHLLASSEIEQLASIYSSLHAEIKRAENVRNLQDREWLGQRFTASRHSPPPTCDTISMVNNNINNTITSINTNNGQTVYAVNEESWFFLLDAKNQLQQIWGEVLHAAMMQTPDETEHHEEIIDDFERIFECHCPYLHAFMLPSHSIVELLNLYLAKYDNEPINKHYNINDFHSGDNSNNYMNTTINTNNRAITSTAYILHFPPEVVAAALVKHTPINSDELNELIRIMKLQECSLPRFVAELLEKAYGKCMKGKQALKVFHEMLDNGLKPLTTRPFAMLFNANTFTTDSTNANNEEKQSILDYYELMLDYGITPEPSTWRILCKQCGGMEFARLHFSLRIKSVTEAAERAANNTSTAHSTNTYCDNNTNNAEEHTKAAPESRRRNERTYFAERLESLADCNKRNSGVHKINHVPLLEAMKAIHRADVEGTSLTGDTMIMSCLLRYFCHGTTPVEMLVWPFTLSAACQAEKITDVIHRLYLQRQQEQSLVSTNVPHTFANNESEHDVHDEFHAIETFANNNNNNSDNVTSANEMNELQSHDDHKADSNVNNNITLEHDVMRDENNIYANDEKHNAIHESNTNSHMNTSEEEMNTEAANLLTRTQLIPLASPGEEAAYVLRVLAQHGSYPDNKLLKELASHNDVFMTSNNNNTSNNNSNNNYNNNSGRVGIYEEVVNAMYSLSKQYIIYFMASLQSISSIQNIQNPTINENNNVNGDNSDTILMSNYDPHPLNAVHPTNIEANTTASTEIVSSSSSPSTVSNTVFTPVEPVRCARLIALMNYYVRRRLRQKVFWLLRCVMVQIYDLHLITSSNAIWQGIHDDADSNGRNVMHLFTVAMKSGPLDWALGLFTLGMLLSHENEEVANNTKARLVSFRDLEYHRSTIHFEVLDELERCNWDKNAILRTHTLMLEPHEMLHFQQQQQQIQKEANETSNNNNVNEMTENINKNVHEIASETISSIYTTPLQDTGAGNGSGNRGNDPHPTLFSYMCLALREINLDRSIIDYFRNELKQARMRALQSNIAPELEDKLEKDLLMEEGKVESGKGSKINILQKRLI